MIRIDAVFVTSIRMTKNGVSLVGFGKDTTKMRLVDKRLQICCLFKLRVHNLK